MTTPNPRPFTTESKSLRVIELRSSGVKRFKDSNSLTLKLPKLLNCLLIFSLCLCVSVVCCAFAVAQTDYTYNKEGIKYLESKDYIKAIASFQTALRLSPGNSVIKQNLSFAYNGYGLALADEGKFDDALTSLREAVRLNPENSVIKQNLAAILIRQAQGEFGKNNLKQAIAILDEAVKEDARNWMAYLELGEAYYTSGKLKEAIDNWKKAKELNPDIKGLDVKLEKAQKEAKIEEKFRQKESMHFNIKYEGYERLDLAYKVLDILREAYREVGSGFHSYPDGPWTVIIYTSEQFKEVTSSPDWSGGIFDGKIRIREGDIIKDENMLKKMLYHEYTHALLFYLTRGNCPAWLNEGLAQIEEPDSGNEMLLTEHKRSVLINAKNNSTLIPASKLDKPFLTYIDQKQVMLAYVESESFVRYIVERFGRFRIKRILELLGDGKSIEESLKTILYKDLSKLESDWIDTIKNN